MHLLFYFCFLFLVLIYWTNITMYADYMRIQINSTYCRVFQIVGITKIFVFFYSKVCDFQSISMVQAVVMYWKFSTDISHCQIWVQQVEIIFLVFLIKANLHQQKMSRRKVEIQSTFRCSGIFRFSISIVPIVKMSPAATFSAQWRLAFTQVIIS